jgi:hypothetical protein
VRELAVVQLEREILTVYPVAVAAAHVHALHAVPRPAKECITHSLADRVIRRTLDGIAVSISIAIPIAISVPITISVPVAITITITLSVAISVPIPIPITVSVPITIAVPIAVPITISGVAISVSVAVAVSIAALFGRAVGLGLRATAVTGGVISTGAQGQRSEQECGQGCMS